MYSWGNHSCATLRWRSSRRPASSSSSTSRRRSSSGISGVGGVSSSGMRLQAKWEGGFSSERRSDADSDRLPRIATQRARASVQTCSNDATMGPAYPSGMPLYRLVEPLPALDGPIVLAAFDGWVDAGSAATNALEAIGTTGTVIATFDPDQLFDYRSRRPTLEIRDGRLSSLAWPEVTLTHVRHGGRDLLIL